MAANRLADGGKKLEYRILFCEKLMNQIIASAAYEYATLQDGAKYCTSCRKHDGIVLCMLGNTEEWGRLYLA